MRLKVEVTERDIKRGVKGDCEACPIALATKRALRNNGLRRYAKYVSVAEDVFASTLTDDCMSANYPQKAGDFITLFDNGGPEAVKPITMTLNFKENS